MPTISLQDRVPDRARSRGAWARCSLLDLGTGSVRVDPNVEHAHHHLVCSGCGSVRDVPADFADVRRARAGTGAASRVEAVEVIFRGVCDDCAATGDPKSPSVQQPTHTRSTRCPISRARKTHDNLKEAFAGESQANRRYLYFAQKADVEGYPDVAALFRSVAEGETGHAFGHFDFLAEVGDPVTGVPVGATDDNLKSAIEGETYEYTEMYPGFAKTARDEGFDEIAEWLETLARAEKSHAGRFTQGLETVS